MCCLYVCNAKLILVNKKMPLDDVHLNTFAAILAMLDDFLGLFMAENTATTATIK